MITGRPTWDTHAIAALLAALGVRNLDLRVRDDLDVTEMLIHYADVLDALRRLRRGTAASTPSSPPQGA